MMLTRPGWSIWKQLFVYPLIVAIIGEAFSIVVAVIDILSPPRMVNGYADTGPNEGLMLGLIIPALYAAYATLVGIFRLLVIAMTNGSTPEQ